PAVARNRRLERERSRPAPRRTGPRTWFAWSQSSEVMTTDALWRGIRDGGSLGGSEYRVEGVNLPGAGLRPEPFRPNPEAGHDRAFQPSFTGTYLAVFATRQAQQGDRLLHLI